MIVVIRVVIFAAWLLGLDWLVFVFILVLVVCLCFEFAFRFCFLEAVALFVQIGLFVCLLVTLFRLLVSLICLCWNFILIWIVLNLLCGLWLYFCFECLVLCFECLLVCFYFIGFNLLGFVINIRFVFIALRVCCVCLKNYIFICFTVVCFEI